jgi:hypothetical protein
MGPVAIIDPRMQKEAVNNLHKNGFITVPVPLTELVEKPLAGHPDIQMFVHGNNLFVHPDVDISFLKKTEKFANIILCGTPLLKNYPGDIPYNIACTGKTSFHRINYTDKTVADYLSRQGIDSVNVNQGYSKCSAMIIDGKSIITSDMTIFKAAEKAGIDCLHITGGHIELPGYQYGFIGGASGVFGDTLYLTGSINHHPDMQEIYGFVESKGKSLMILSSERVTDTGSIFFIS